LESVYTVKSRIVGSNPTPSANSSRGPHPPYVFPRWRPEQTAVLPAELRWALVAHQTSRPPGVEVLANHQMASLLQPQLLLVLKRARASDGPEALPKRGRAHVHTSCEFVEFQWLLEVLFEPGDRPGDLLTGRSAQSQMLEPGSMRPDQQTNRDFTLDHGREMRSQRRLSEELDQSDERIHEGRIQSLDGDGRTGWPARRRQPHLRRNLRDVASVQGQHERKHGLGDAGSRHAGHHWQVYCRQQ
jgi:hypothetical protein